MTDISVKSNKMKLLLERLIVEILPSIVVSTRTTELSCHPTLENHSLLNLNTSSSAYVQTHFYVTNVSDCRPDLNIPKVSVGIPKCCTAL